MNLHKVRPPKVAQSLHKVPKGVRALCLSYRETVCLCTLCTVQEAEPHGISAGIAHAREGRLAP